MGGHFFYLGDGTDKASSAAENETGGIHITIPPVKSAAKCMGRPLVIQSYMVETPHLVSTSMLVQHAVNQALAACWAIQPRRVTECAAVVPTLVALRGAAL